MVLSAHGGGTSEGLAHGHRGRKLTMRGVKACLDKVLALWLRNEGLQLGSSEGVDETRLRDDEEEHLSAGEGGELISLKRNKNIR